MVSKYFLFELQRCLHRSRGGQVTAKPPVTFTTCRKWSARILRPKKSCFYKQLFFFIFFLEQNLSIVHDDKTEKWCLWPTEGSTGSHCLTAALPKGSGPEPLPGSSLVFACDLLKREVRPEKCLSSRKKKWKGKATRFWRVKFSNILIEMFCGSKKKKICSKSWGKQNAPVVLISCSKTCRWRWKERTVAKDNLLNRKNTGCTSTEYK